MRQMVRKFWPHLLIALGIGILFLDAYLTLIRPLPEPATMTFPILENSRVISGDQVDFPDMLFIRVSLKELLDRAEKTHNELTTAYSVCEIPPGRHLQLYHWIPPQEGVFYYTDQHFRWPQWGRHLRIGGIEIRGSRVTVYPARDLPGVVVGGLFLAVVGCLLILIGNITLVFRREKTPPQTV